MNGSSLEIEYLHSSKFIFLKPWEIISGDRMILKRDGLRERFPDATLFPFAVRTDCDDVACFDFNTTGKVFVIHDYSSVGWERREIFDSFWDWFYQAVEDMVEFAKEDIAYEREKRK
ncbi:MAG: hypothetical protein ABWZ25_15115 [Chitinophagaceae bacterium]